MMIMMMMMMMMMSAQLKEKLRLLNLETYFTEKIPNAFPGMARIEAEKLFLKSRGFFEITGISTPVKPIYSSHYNDPF